MEEGREEGEREREVYFYTHTHTQLLRNSNGKEKNQESYSEQQQQPVSQGQEQKSHSVEDIDSAPTPTPGSVNPAPIEPLVAAAANPMAFHEKDQLVAEKDMQVTTPGYIRVIPHSIRLCTPHACSTCKYHARRDTINLTAEHTNLLTLYRDFPTSCNG